MKPIKQIRHKPRKEAVESTIAGLVHFIMKSQYRGNGISVLSLTGPDIRRHYENYKQLLGNAGTLHSIERDIEVHKGQIIQNHMMKNKNLKLHYGDFFEVADGLFGNNRIRSHVVYFDLDTCDLLSTIMKDYPEGFRKLAHLTSGCDQVWLSVTYTLRTGGRRGGNRGNGKRLDKISSAFTRARCGWKRTFHEVLSYKDGAPMATSLWSFDRK